MKISQLIELSNKQSTTTRRHIAQRQETDLDPKPPLKPVTVAEPIKPKKPKYKGI